MIEFLKDFLFRILRLFLSEYRLFSRGQNNLCCYGEDTFRKLVMNIFEYWGDVIPQKLSQPQPCNNVQTFTSTLLSFLTLCKVKYFT